MDAMFNRCAGSVNDREFLYAVHSYHMGFHLRIADGASCGALRRAVEKNHVLILNWLFDIAAHRPPLPPRFHRDLADAMNQENPEEADKAMRRHIRYGLSTVVNEIGPPAAAPKKEVRQKKAARSRT
jgi:DNA-binding GntR family transcriptional regulator